MGWFQRYGIPGAYFAGLVITGMYAFLYPEVGKDWDARAVVGLGVILFLPVGYIISIASQALYLYGVWERLRVVQRVHSAAMKRIGIVFPGFLDNLGDRQGPKEEIVEARTLLLTALDTRTIPFESNRFIRDWIARRIDVIAINSSIIMASMLAIVIFLILYILFRATFQWEWLGAFASIMVAAVLATLLANRVLQRQIVDVIAGLYRRHLEEITGIHK